MAVIFSFRVVFGRRQPQQGQQPPPTTPQPPQPPQPQTTTTRPESARPLPPSTEHPESGRRLSSDPESAHREPQATQSQVDGVTMGRGSDAGPFLFQIEVAAIPEGGWEVSLQAGSGPVWLWWSVVVAVVLLLWLWAMRTLLAALLIKIST